MTAPTAQLYDIEQLHDWKVILVDLLRSRIELEGSFYIFKDYELSDFKKIIKRQLDIDFSLGISEYCYSLEDIKAGYAQALAEEFKIYKELNNANNLGAMFSGLISILLTETNEKIAIIAERVGYSDESYFSKAFKRYFGVTPKNYGQ